MTTKLTEAEIKALPVCTGCGRHPIRCPHDASKVGCQDVNTCWMFGWWPDVKWRILMTPEAKVTGKRRLADILIKNLTDLRDILRKNKTKDGTPDWDKVFTELEVLADSPFVSDLQSKLAKSEERVKELEGKIATMIASECWVRCQYCDAVFENESRKVRVAWGTEHDQKCLKHPMRELERERDSLKQKLAEATKPVGEDDVETAIIHLNDDVEAWTAEGGEDANSLRDDYNTLIRAARQRKPSGDTITLAKWIKKNLLNMDEKCSCDSCTGRRLAHNFADSILAQAAAADSVAKEIITASTEGVARVPAADLLTPTQRHWIEREREYCRDPKSHTMFQIIDRLAPARSAATPDPFMVCSDRIAVVRHEKGETVDISMRSIDTWGESWWWHQKSRDGKIVCISEAFDNASDARIAANEQAKKLGGVEVVDLTQKGA